MFKVYASKGAKLEPEIHRLSPSNPPNSLQVEPFHEIRLIDDST